MVSTRLFFSQSRTVHPPNLLLKQTKTFPCSPMKHIFVLAYTRQPHPRHAMSLWSPDKPVPLQFTLDFPFLKTTLENYSFSHMSIIVQLLLKKAAKHTAIWSSSSVIAAYSRIDASQPWCKVMPQLFKVMLSSLGSKALYVNMHSGDAKRTDWLMRQ